MRKGRVLASVLLLILLLAACAPSTASSPEPAPRAAATAPSAAPAAAAPVAKAPAKPGWEVEWEKTLAAAKQEGRLVIHAGAVRDTITKIAKLQGLEAEVLSSRATEYLPKLVLEQRAGLYLTDVYVGGQTSLTNIAKKAGILEPLDSMLIMPHLTDPEVIKKSWFQGELPWMDKEHMAFMLTLQPGLAMAINTDLVKPDEIKSWRDLLDPKWKGKWAFFDPAGSGGYGANCFQTLVYTMGEDFVRALANEKPLITKDKRLPVDWLAHGKVAIAVAPAPEVLVEFQQAGVGNIKPVTPQEGTWVAGGALGAIGLFKNSAHPNSAKVFINALTGKESQEMIGPASGLQSTRADVSTAHLPSGMARVEGVKYYKVYTEENLARQVETAKLAQQLFR